MVRIYREEKKHTERCTQSVVGVDRARKTESENTHRENVEKERVSE